MGIDVGIDVGIEVGLLVAILVLLYYFIKFHQNTSFAQGPGRPDTGTFNDCDQLEWIKDVEGSTIELRGTV